MNEIIKAVIFIVITTLIIKVLNKGSRKIPSKNDKGELVLKAPLLYGIIGIILTLVSLVTLVLIIHYLPKVFIIPIMFLLIVGGFALLFTLNYLVVNITLTEESIIKTNMFGRKLTIHWNEIKFVNYNKFMDDLIIESQRLKIKCPQHFIGYNLIIDELENKTGGSYQYLKVKSSK